MWIRKRIGLGTDLCGTPDKTVHGSESVPFRATLCVVCTTRKKATDPLADHIFYISYFQFVNKFLVVHTVKCLTKVEHNCLNLPFIVHGGWPLTNSVSWAFQLSYVSGDDVLEHFAHYGPLCTLG